MSEPVAILGATGALGYGLALRLSRAGVPVTIGSRDAERAEASAATAREATGGAVTGAANPEAAASAEIVVLSVPFASQAATLKGVREQLRPGQIVVDATVPLATAVGGRPTRVLGVWQGSAAEQAEELLPEGVGIVAALHTVSAASLADLDHGLDEDVLLCGDDREQKRRVAELLRNVAGLRPVDAGKLEMAHVVEQLTALMISLNARYKTHAGIHVTGLPAGGWPQA